MFFIKRHHRSSGRGTLKREQGSSILAWRGFIKRLGTTSHRVLCGGWVFTCRTAWN